MDNPLLDFHAELLSLRHTKSAWDKLLGFVGDLGVTHVHTWFGTSSSEMDVSTTCPDWWVPHYMEHEYWRDDVLFSHCVQGFGPMAYGVDRSGRNPRMPEKSVNIINSAKDSLRLGSGIGFPVFLPDGRRIGGVNLGISGTLEEFDRMPTSDILAAVMASTAVHTRLHALETMGLDEAQLTNRERECLLWIAKGLRTKEISDKLNLSDHTVTFHLANAKSKLGAETREQAVARAVVLGLIVP